MCDVSEWTTNQVGMWLQANGFSQYVELFCVAHKIDGLTLLTLTESDLRSPPLEISILGDIKKLMIKINKLKLENREAVEGLGLCDSDTSVSSPRSRISEFQNHVTTERLESESSTYSDLDDLGVDKSGVPRRFSSRLAPEYTKWILSYVYMFSVFLLTAIVMVIVHDRVPDMNKYPPLPDIVLDNMPYVPWAFDMCEVAALLLMIIWIIILVFHKHRFILMRRWFALTGTVFLLRCVTMLITSLSVPGTHLECQPKVDGDMWSKFYRALVIWKGFGMSLQGVRTCGDYMFSGHTVIVTMINFFITEYSPRRMHLLHTATWVLNLFGIFFILAAHEHYSIDVFVAFYITSRLFLYYHSLANNRALKQHDYKRTRIWFPLFSFFESKVDGMVPNEYEWPSLWPRSFNLSLLENEKVQ